MEVCFLPKRLTRILHIQDPCHRGPSVATVGLRECHEASRTGLHSNAQRLGPKTQRAQRGLLKEYILDRIRDLYVNSGLILS